MNTLSYQTKSVSAAQVKRTWYVVDAENATTGRLSARVAAVLRGKHKPTFTPNADTGDYVIIINANKIRFTGKKFAQKEYLDYSLYPGGLRVTGADEMLEKHPERILERAIKGMLPKTKLGRAMIKKLFVYAGPEHPHAAQQPVAMQF